MLRQSSSDMVTDMTSGARTRLFWTLIFFEACVISITAYTGLNMAVARGGSFAMALPLLMIAAAETLRIPLSGYATQLSWPKQILAGLVLIAIALGSAEGLSLAFEQFVNNRVVSISQAQRSFLKAKAIVDTQKNDKRLDQIALAVARDDVARLDVALRDFLNNPPGLPSFSGRTCTGRFGKAVTCDSDRRAQETYAQARQSHNLQLENLRAERQEAQVRVDQLKLTPKADMLATETFDDARQHLIEEMSQSPIHRFTASIYGVPVEDLTENQFQTVKKYGVISLAIAFAIVSMLASVVVHTEPHDKSESKVSRALRAWIARRRKPIVRVVEKIIETPVEVIKEVERRIEVPVEKIVFKYIPFDYTTGRRASPEYEYTDSVSLKTVRGGKE
jgi:hypothetical protein